MADRDDGGLRHTGAVYEASTDGVRLTSMTSEADRTAFRDISTEWIEQYFSLTDADRLLLDDPAAAIVARGGDVLVARVDGNDDVVGCVALIAYPDHVMELSKMGVRPSARGRGIGDLLVVAALDRAAQLGAERVFLGTNSRLGAARHLYERHGFTTITAADLPVEDYYARADILLERSL